jgi:streptomycin 6-kinase
MEAEQEIDGLRFWDGNPTVRLLAADDSSGAMLMERCTPGTALRACPEPEQDSVISRLLPRLWRIPPVPHPFRPLSALIDSWGAETLADKQRWPEPAIVREGLRLFSDLPRTAPRHVLLATDLVRSRYSNTLRIRDMR